MLTGQSRAGDVLDVGTEAQVLQALAPIELVPPGRTPDLTAVTLAIGKDFQGSHTPRVVDPNRVGNHVLPSEDLVHEHVTQQVVPPHGLPGSQRAMRRLRARK